MGWKGYIALTILTALVVFVAQNYEVVEIRFLFWTFQASRSIVIFLTLLIGIVLGWLTSHWSSKDKASTPS